MANTNYGVNAPEAQKLWRSQLFEEALKATWFGKFMGESSNDVVQMLTNTKKAAGDRITVTLRMQLTGDGVLGDATMEGNEEALVTYTDNLFIDQLRNAVRSGGKMTEQRIPWSIREEAMTGLADWWAGRFDQALFNQVCGYTVQTDLRYTGNNPVVAPDSAHIYRPNSRANDQSLTTGAAVATARRAVLMGAQAATIAFGQGQSPDAMDWNEELFDYGNQLGVEAGCIYGMKKTRFNSADFGTVVMASYTS